jgi:hypothetical protein
LTNAFVGVHEFMGNLLSHHSLLNAMTTGSQSAILFVAKSLVFTLIFWTVWYALQGWTSPSSSQQGAAARAAVQQEAALAHAAAQSAAYDEQMMRAGRQLDKSDAYQQRMDVWLTAQEKNQERFDKVLQAWEKQTGLRK